MGPMRNRPKDRKSTRLNSSHTVIYTLSLHDALPISSTTPEGKVVPPPGCVEALQKYLELKPDGPNAESAKRSEEHTSELQSHRDLHSFPTRRSSDLFHHSRGQSRAASGLRGSFAEVPRAEARWAQCGIGQ